MNPSLRHGNSSRVALKAAYDTPDRLPTTDGISPQLSPAATGPLYRTSGRPHPIARFAVVLSLDREPPLLTVGVFVSILFGFGFGFGYIGATC